MLNIMNDIDTKSEETIQKEITNENIPEELFIDSEGEHEEDAPTPEELEDNAENMKKKVRKASGVVTEIIIYLAIIVLCINIIPRYVVQRTIVDGKSMLNTLKDKENVLVEKVSYHFHDPRRFDVVVFFPHGKGSSDYFIKRVIGLPGETVQIVGSTIYINGEELKENYGKDPITFQGLAAEPIVLGEDEFFLLGDNRDISKDSRYEEVGAVKRENIAGRAILRIYPFDKFGDFDKKYKEDKSQKESGVLSDTKTASQKTVNILENTISYAVPSESASLQFTKKVSKIKAGKKIRFKVTGNTAAIKWSVSNTKYASINSQGDFVGKRVGRVTVTASDAKAKVKCNVKILGKKKIAIDAGHQLKANSGMESVGPGSSTKKPKVSGGASGVVTKVAEYQLNLNIAKKLKAELLKRGYDVYMIRTKHNVNISNKERAQKANNSGSDIYIRLHSDSSESQSARGASALYPSKSNPYVGKISGLSKKLSKKVLAKYCAKTGIRNRGIIVRDDLTGTNWSKIPVTLIEMGFLSNPSEDRLLQKKKTQQNMAYGLADGIDAYFGY